MLYRTCLTLRWVMAVLAIVICCSGNEYPAKSHHAHFGEDVLNRTSAIDAATNQFVQWGERSYQEQRLRQIIREELN